MNIEIKSKKACEITSQAFLLYKPSITFLEAAPHPQHV